LKDTERSVEVDNLSESDGSDWVHPRQ